MSKQTVREFEAACFFDRSVVWNDRVARRARASCLLSRAAPLQERSQVASPQIIRSAGMYSSGFVRGCRCDGFSDAQFHDTLVRHIVFSDFLLMYNLKISAPFSSKTVV